MEEAIKLIREAVTADENRDFITALPKYQQGCRLLLNQIPSKPSHFVTSAGLKNDKMKATALKKVTEYLARADHIKSAPALHVLPRLPASTPPVIFDRVTRMWRRSYPGLCGPLLEERDRNVLDSIWSGDGCLLLELPREMLELVLYNLSSRSVRNLSACNRYLRDFVDARDHGVWTRLVWRDFPLMVNWLPLGESWKRVYLALEQLFPLVRPREGWESVVGMKEAKDITERLVLPLKFPQLFTGSRMPHFGIMLYGPSGCGKRKLVRAGGLPSALTS